MFRPENYAPSKTDHDAVKARGKEIFEKGLALLNEKMAGKDYVLGGQFSIADAALFYIEFWAGRVKIPLPANLQAHFDRMKARPAVKATFAAEGLPA
jgi:glutathione S-transferase